MASNDPYSQVKDSIDKSQRNSSSEHEETIKVDQMKTTAKKLSTSNDEKVSSEICREKYWKIMEKCSVTASWRLLRRHRDI